MKKAKLFNKKAIIVIPIVLALLLGSVGTIGLIGGFLQGENNQPPVELSKEEMDALIEEQIKELKDSSDDETVHKIIDIHVKLDNYIDTSQTLDVQFFEFNDEYSDELDSKYHVGIEYEFEDGYTELFGFPVDLSKVDLPADIKDYDWVKISGKIGSTEEVYHDHINIVPIIHISSIEKIEKQK